MLSPTLRGTLRNKVRAPRCPQMTAHEDLQHFNSNHVHTHDIPPGVRRKRWSRRSTSSIEGGKGYFVNREWLVLFPVKCEITPVLFLVKRDFGNRREPWFLFNSPWTLIFYHVIVNSLREIKSTVGYILRYWNVILDPGPSTRGRDNLGNVSGTANMAETRSEVKVARFYQI